MVRPLQTSLAQWAVQWKLPTESCYGKIHFLKMVHGSKLELQMNGTGRRAISLTKFIQYLPKKLQYRLGYIVGTIERFIK